MVFRLAYMVTIILAGLIDDVRKRRVGPEDAVVFIHTGGTPAVFAYRDELINP